MRQKTALVCGAGGFIGSHMVKRLKSEGYWVKGVDLKYPEFSETKADRFVIADLREIEKVKDAFDVVGGFDEVYQFAADMGGAGYIFTGENDADLFSNSMQINLNVAEAAITFRTGKLFYSSSACIYPSHIQEQTKNPGLKESDAYPANPDSAYGWEKLASENLYNAYYRNYGLDIRIGRFHNIFGPEGTWTGGREKSVAAMCRKVAEAHKGGKIVVWGDGEQTRSYLFIDDCIEAVRRLMNVDFHDPLNIGSEELISINNLVKTIIKIADREKDGLVIYHEKENKNLGVRGRRSNNDLMKKVLKWSPNRTLYFGLADTYGWIEQQVARHKPKESNADFITAAAEEFLGIVKKNNP